MSTNQVGIPTTGPGSLAYLVSQLGTTPATIWINQPQNITVNLTVPTTIELKFIEGGYLNTSNAVTTTILGPIDASWFYIFRGAGNYVFTTGDDGPKEFSLEWFYPASIENFAGDAYPYFQKAIDALPTSGTLTYHGQKLFYVTNTLDFSAKTNVTFKTVMQEKYRAGGNFPLIAWAGGTAPNTALIKLWGNFNKIQGWVLKSNYTIGAGCDFGIDIDGDNTHYTSENTVCDCTIYNAGNDGIANPNWVGISIARTWNSNVDFMRFQRNYLFQYPGGGKAFSVANNGSLNSHSHLLQDTTCWYCDYFWNQVGGGVWSQYCFTEFIGSSGNAGCFTYRFRLGELASIVDFHNDENCAQFAYCNIQSPLMFRGCRVGSSPTGSKGLYQVDTACGALTLLNNVVTVGAPSGGNAWLDWSTAGDNAQITQIGDGFWSGGYSVWDIPGTKGYYIRLNSGGSAMVINDQTGNNHSIAFVKGGIVFPGSSELQNYNEYPWTPTFAPQNIGDLNVTYTKRYGNATRIGNRVNFTFSVAGSLTYTTASGRIFITGLPVASSGGLNEAISTILASGLTLDAGFTQVTGFITPTDTGVQIWEEGSTQVAAPLVLTNAIASGGTFSIQGTGTYQVG